MERGIYAASRYDNTACVEWSGTRYVGQLKRAKARAPLANFARLNRPSAWAFAFGRRELMNDFFDNWTVQVRKGLLEFCILSALADKERYGYELVKSLVDIPGLGMTEGTLYPLLSRLRGQGLVSTRLEASSEGPARKYYSLTKEGRKIAATMDAYLEDLNQSVTALRKKGVTV